MSELFMFFFDVAYLAIGVSYTILVFFVLRLQREVSARGYLLFFVISLLLWHASLYAYLFMPLGNYLLPLARFNYAMGPLFTFGLLGFFYRFQGRTYRVPSVVEWSFWSWTLFLAIVSQFTDWVDKNEVYVEGGGIDLELGFLYPVYMVHMFVMPLLTFFLGIWKVYKLKGLSQIKFGFSFWIFVPTMFAFVVTNGILPLYGVYWFQYSPIFLVPIAISSTIAMYRFRFFNLPYSSLQIARKSILISSYIITALLVYAIIRQFSGDDYIWGPISISSVISLFVYSKLNHCLPDFITQDLYLFQSLIKKLQGTLFYLKTYQELITLFEKVFLIDLKLSSVQVLMIQDQQKVLNIPHIYRHKAIKVIENMRAEILVKSELDMGSGRKQRLLSEFLEENKAELLLPIYLEKRCIAVVFLGEKSENTVFSKEEINEFISLRNSIEIAFINILLQGDLKEENNLMKKHIQEKTKTLREQNKHISQLLRQQSDFLAVTAHEFRTPLNIALLQLEDTLESFDLSSQVLEDMEILEDSLSKLRRLTQDLFDIQQYDMEKVSLVKEKTSIHQLFKTVERDFTDFLLEKDLQFKTNNNTKKDRFLLLDKGKIHQVFTNLITNASKFTPAGGVIGFTVYIADEILFFEISDSGPGVPPEDQERIFEKFQTVRVSSAMGIGMGLYLSRKIIELHEGKLYYKSNSEHGGANFVLEIPLSVVSLL